MILKPIGEKVVMEPIKEENKKGGIILTSQQDNRALKGKVVAVGDCKFVKEGDIALYQDGTALKTEIDEKDLLIILEKAILAIVEE